MSGEKTPFVLPQLHSWIDGKFFKKVLQRSKDDWTLRIKTVDIELGCNIGDNYGGVLYRVKVTTEVSGEEKIHSLFVKCLPDVDFIKKFIVGMQLSQKEAAFYNTLLPQLNNFLQKHSSKLNITDNFPKCYYAYADGQNDVIVMENLKDSGYKMANRKLGMDYNHCKLAFRGLAHFHATTYALKVKEPDIFQKLIQHFKETTYTTETKPVMGPFSIMGLETMSKNASGIRRCEHLSDKIDALKDKAFDMTIELVRPKEPTAVFCLGDCWVNNMLFRYKSSSDGGDEVPESIKFVDFQMVRYASPALDLVYMIYSSTTGKLRKQHLNDLMILYYETFSTLLRDLGVDPDTFSYEMFQKEWKEHLMYGLLVGTMALGAVTTNEEKLEEVEIMDDDDLKDAGKMSEKMSAMYNTSLYKERLSDVLKDFESFGLLE